MVLKIDGVDIVPYIKFGGLKWQRSDVDSSKTTRALDGTLERVRVATKRRLDVECRPLTSEEVKIVLDSIMPVWVEVEYYDPQDGKVVTRTMYSNNNPATYAMKRPDNTEWWDGVTFPLIER